MRSLLKFFLLTYLVSWTVWIAATYVGGGTAAPPFRLAVITGLALLLGTLAPSLVALALTAQAEGRAGVLALLRKIVPSPSVGVSWYVFAVSYFAAIKLGVALVHRLVRGAWPAFGQTPWYIMAVAMVISTPVQAGEEIGWRGYALPLLAGETGLAGASIVLGMIWACWHLPFFLIPGSDNYGQSFPVYLLAVTAISVAMAWLYWRSNGSLLLTMLMHAAINNTAGIVASPPSPGASPFTNNPPLLAWFTAALLWICALFFLVQMRGVTLQQARQPNSLQH
jgi:membrane protease YdiL (CAAX protease family)